MTVMKAQIEFIAILGVIIILVVAAFYALQISQNAANPVPSGTGAEQSLVKDRIEGIIRDGALLSVKWMESQGGSVLPDFGNSVSFTRVMVPYWQKCGNTYVPSLETLTQRLENATRNYIARSLQNRTETVLGKDVAVSLEDSKVTASILDNKIELMVSLPTTVQGYAIQQPYRVSIPTKFGEIYGFMKSYAEEAAKNRYIELFLINSIYFSSTKSEGGGVHAELPTVGALTECGETLDRSSAELSTSMEELVEYTLANVQWWAPAPAVSQSAKVYTIESLKGKTYSQLNPLFMVDDNFGISIGQSVHLTNPKPLAKADLIFTQFETTGLCLGTYSISYSFRTPVILRVQDDLTNNPFNIATLVDINDLMPGSCGEMPTPQYCTYNPDGSTSCTGSGTPPALDCGNCTARMKIVLPDGSPARGASALFGGCMLIADSSGFAEGPVSCDAGDLLISYAAGTAAELYQRRSCSILPSALNDTISLYKYPKLVIHFREVNLTTCNAGATSNYVLINTTSGDGCMGAANNVGEISGAAACTDTATCSQQLAMAEAMENTTSDAFQPGNHSISAVMFSTNGSESKSLGAFESSFIVGTGSSDVFVYVPLYINASLASYNYTMSMTQLMMTNCSINPVMEVDKA